MHALDEASDLRLITPSLLQGRGQHALRVAVLWEDDVDRAKARMAHRSAVVQVVYRSRPASV
jgi:hypothetical protein